MPPRRQSNPRSAEHAALGEAVCVLRAEAGLSQEALADAAHVHITLLGGLERGTGNPNYATIVKLARALNMTPGTLVSRADDIARTQAPTRAKANSSPASQSRPAGERDRRGRNPRDALDSRIQPRKERRGERYVTETIAAIGQRDTPFAIQLARALLEAAAAAGGAPGDRAATLLRHVPRRRLDLFSEHFVPHDGLADIARDIHRSRIDWLFTGDAFALAVEVKTNRRTGFGYRQLESYHRALKTRNSPIAKPFSGLMALVPVQPFRDELISARRRRFFLGVVLWEQAGPALRRIVPADPGDAGRWDEILGSLL